MYRILYDTPVGVKDYTVDPMPLQKAREVLSKFKSLYLNPDGTGKPFPNGKGSYQISNPRIVPA